MEQNKTTAYTYLRLIWPTVYRIINGGLYFIFSLIKAGVKIAINQMKGNAS